MTAAPGNGYSVPVPVSVPASVGPRVVGLGASAGGLAVLQDFLANVPAHSGLVYVVVQHLDPTHKPMLVTLLERSTAMPVAEATQGMVMEADKVYVIPPDRDLTVVAGALHLAAPAQPRGLRLPINLLFSSLARDQGERAVGVVLTGMGSDGTQGLQAIKSQGGLTLAQLPESAQFDSMPKSAIAAGCVDIVALAHEMPARILRVTGGPDTAVRPPDEDMEEDSEAGALGTILKLLRAHSRHNLSEYKSSTLQRRIQRRMGVHGLLTREAYVAFIQQNPQELDLLFKEVLIGVTSFFRDPAVWDELKDSVLPALIVSSAPGARLRAWVAGCSTGEEAYSLAMVFAEVAATLPGLPRTLQIFASDLSADAIAAARRGSFHARIASEMSSERLARFFVARGKGYTIAKGIREMMLFAQHDLIQDPPFTRLDLLSCRNLLIYFDASLQRRLIPLFGYSLRPGGVLLLGGSETIGNATAQFSTISSKARLYSRNQLPVVGTLLDFPVGSHWPTSRPKKDLIVQPNSVTPPANLQALAEHALLMEFSPPAVVVNSQGDVIFINGSVGKYLEPAAGKANWNVHVMARPAIRAQIAAALRQAQQDDKPVELRGLKLDDGALATLDVIVKTLHEPKALTGLVMMVFREVAGPVGRRRRKTSADAPNPELARELQSLKDEVNALRQQMGSSAEELQAANEELQSTNEELQSANEELTTSKEESQSMNEELQTLNSELQSKLDDLALAQSDMQNLLNSTDIATLFLDSELNVRRFTEQITRIFQLRDIDIGRPLTDLASTLIYPGMYADARDTLRSLSFTEKQIATTDGLWFMVRIKPYRTLSNVIQGVVVTLIDITAAKELESRLRKA